MYRVTSQVRTLSSAVDELQKTPQTFENAGIDVDYTLALQASVNTKAPKASPSFTGTVSGIAKTMVGLGNADNTADAAKLVSTAAQAALDLKADAVTTYTKTETDAKLDLKASQATTYTKTEADELLDGKADKATTYTKT